MLFLKKSNYDILREMNHLNFLQKILSGYKVFKI